MPTNPPGELSLMALVYYLPAPLGTFLDEMRRSFPAQKGGRAHLTFLAPRPLALPADRAREIIRSTLDSFEAFDVELTEVFRFPTSNVIYIGVGQGSESAHGIHEALNKALPAYPEPFDYRPHISLVYPTEGADLDRLEAAATEAWKTCRLTKRFRVENVDFLQNTGSGDWEPLWNCAVGSQASPSRGVFRANT